MTASELQHATQALRDWQLAHLPALRNESPSKSRYFEEVSLVIYSFPKKGTEAAAFPWIEFAIRYSWHHLGQLKTVLVVDRPFNEAVTLAQKEQAIELQVESNLHAGDIQSMSTDCIQRLHTRFTTPYCLIIQDDGFPLRDNLGDFLGKADYWGAPIICDGLQRKFFYAIGLGSYNGGFSLRSRRLCAFASEMWERFFSKLGLVCGEDFYYTFYLRLLPQAWGRFRFPSENTAFQFAFDDLAGYVTLPLSRVKPFGAHGKTTLARLLRHGEDL